MKKVSFWAKNHKWQSRVLIVIIYVLLNFIGVFTGKLLREINIILPNYYFVSCVLLIIPLWLWYPNKNKSVVNFTTSSSYVRRKFFDFSLCMITFLMMIYASNNRDHIFLNTEPVQASKIVRISKDSALYNNPLIKNFISAIKSMDVSKLSEREKLRIIKAQIKTIKHSKDASKSDKTMLIILSILLAIALLIGLAALSCSIACAGSGALAIVVFLGGTFFIIFFLAKAIKRISHPKISQQQGM